jgi:hypothetical protein
MSSAAVAAVAAAVAVATATAATITFNNLAMRGKGARTECKAGREGRGQRRQRYLE